MDKKNQKIEIIYDPIKNKPRAYYPKGKTFVRFPVALRTLGAEFKTTLRLGFGANGGEFFMQIGDIVRVG